MYCFSLGLNTQNVGTVFNENIQQHRCWGSLADGITNSQPMDKRFKPQKSKQISSCGECHFRIQSRCQLGDSRGLRDLVSIRGLLSREDTEN
ncbi:hypothetical protein NPIL_227371 [Nephila pilipes]|uniref:Uncharacterized protein n=1 Tax=Nephila pilipes TaxID=299642 RepID=A0A8X6NQF7_NEPPI|nr:hypothetical protein NPIL_227371 [Nephila pilipes]